MRGFMCQPHAATAVCDPGDPRSVVVPRRPDRILVDHARIVNLRYTRLVDSRRLAAPAMTSSTRQERLLRVVAVPASAGAERRLEVAAVPTKAAMAAPRVASVRRGLEVPSRPSTCDHVFQVVVMRVSLHCQGCAGKVKKHISKMEGVTSFSIDLESKRVTVMGRVSPAGVLESISKVKKAEFWPTTTTTTTTTTTPPVKA